MNDKTINVQAVPTMRGLRHYLDYQYPASRGDLQLNRFCNELQLTADELEKRKSDKSLPFGALVIRKVASDYYDVEVPSIHRDFHIRFESGFWVMDIFASTVLEPDSAVLERLSFMTLGLALLEIFDLLEDELHARKNQKPTV